MRDRAGSMIRPLEFVHVAFNDAYAHSSTRSAAAGGVTTIVDMPYDDGDLIASADRVRAKAAEAEANARVDVALYGTCHPDEGPARIAEMVAAGVAAFKFSTFGTHPTRFPSIPPQMLHDRFDEIAKFGLTAGVHNENHEVAVAATERVKATGITDYRAHGLSRPEIAEALAITEVYEIGAATGCHAHVVHCSVRRGYDLCHAYRAQGFSADRIWSDLMALADKTEAGRPYTRRSFSPRFPEGRAWLQVRFRAAGLTTHVGPSGNMPVTLSSRRTLSDAPPAPFDSGLIGRLEDTARKNGLGHVRMPSSSRASRRPPWSSCQAAPVAAIAPRNGPGRTNLPWARSSSSAPSWNWTGALTVPVNLHGPAHTGCPAISLVGNQE